MRGTKSQIIEFISEKLRDLVYKVENNFDAEFNLDSTDWKDLEATIMKTILANEILSDEEMRENELLNHADDLSDEDRGR